MQRCDLPVMQRREGFRRRVVCWCRYSHLVLRPRPTPIYIRMYDLLPHCTLFDYAALAMTEGILMRLSDYSSKSLCAHHLMAASPTHHGSPNSH